MIKRLCTLLVTMVVMLAAGLAIARPALADTALSLSATYGGSAVGASTSAGSSADPVLAGEQVTFSAAWSFTTAPSGSCTVVFESTSSGQSPVPFSTQTVAATATGATAVYAFPNASTTGAVVVDTIFAQLTCPGQATSQVAGVYLSVLPDTIYNTSVSLTATPSTIVAGQSVTLSATVVRNGASGVPTGVVIFNNVTSTNVNIAEATLNSSGVATTVVGGWQVGTYSITASYEGDIDDVSSSATVPASVTVNPATNLLPTTTSISLSASAIVAGEGVTIRTGVTPGTVSPSEAVPTGQVALFDGAQEVVSATLVNGSATFGSVAGWQPGVEDLTVQYQGDQYYASSVSPVDVLTVSSVGTAVATTTTLSSNLSPIVAGAPDTLTATITQASPAASPVGDQVVFDSGGSYLGEAPIALVGSAYQASLTLSGWVGSATPLSLTASFGGDAANLQSTSAPLSETVVTASTSTGVSASTASGTAGQAVTFTAAVTVAAPGVNPAGGGTVTFTTVQSGATLTLCGGVALTSSGQAGCTYAFPAGGSYLVTATYSGSAVDSGSSGTLPFTVTAQLGAPVIKTPAGGSYVAAPVTLTGTGTAGATVTLRQGTSVLGTATVSSGGTWTTTALPLAAGAYSVTATQALGSASSPAGAADAFTVYANTSGGSFVIGYQGDAVGSQVTFWSGLWPVLNPLPGSDSPLGFMGWAPTVNASTWSVNLWSLTAPPVALPAYISVIVTSKVTAGFLSLSGNVACTAIVKVGPGYAPDLFHQGTGTVVATVGTCPSPTPPAPANPCPGSPCSPCCANPCGDVRIVGIE